ncbi:MAG: hypothetical protein AAFW60_08340 [Pseudomonadota bacterium]
MSSFDYSGSLATAKRLIDRFGKTVTLIKKSKHGETHRPVYETSQTDLRSVDLEKETRDKDGTMTGETRRKLLIEGGASAVPAKSDKVKIKGVEHEVDFVKELNPGDTTVLYTVYLVS